MTDTADSACTDPIPSWVAYSGVGVVGGTALAVLAYYQHRFGADFAKMPAWASWTFSIGLDWGSAVAGVFWFFGAGALARWGRWLAISLVAASTVLTCIAWGLIAGWPFAPLGVIHPLVAFAMAKLLTLWQADRLARRRAVDALDAYRADTENHRVAVLADLEQHQAAIEQHRVAVAEQLEREQAALVQRQQLLLATTAAALAAVTTARPPRPYIVPPAGGASRPSVGGDTQQPEDVALLGTALQFIQAADQANEPFGQRPFAEHTGKSRDRIRVPHTAACIHLGKDVSRVPEQARQDARALLEAARDVLDVDSVIPHVNGRKYPTPTAGA